MKSDILSSHVLSDNYGVLRQYRMRYARTDGSRAEMEREVYHRGSAASVLLYNQVKKTVILVRQFRPAPMVNGDNPYLLEACAGVLEGDDPVTCATREAKEETGISALNLKLVSVAYASPAAFTETVAMYIGNYGADEKVGRAAGLAEEGEDTEVIEMPLEVAFAMIEKGDIIDMKTIVLLQALMLQSLKD